MGKDEKIFSRMVDTNRIRNHEKELAAITAIKKMITDDVTVTVAGLMEQTGLSRSFFYNNETVHKEVSRAKRLQQGRDLEAPKRRVMDKAMAGRLSILEEQLSKRNEECDKLREENEKLRGIITASNLRAYQDL